MHSSVAIPPNRRSLSWISSIWSVASVSQFVSCEFNVLIKTLISERNHLLVLDLRVATLGKQRPLLV